MKNIELTENQKVKLLEMCKVLFPEVKIHTGMLSDGSQAPEKVLDSPVDLEWGTEWDLPYISVGIKEIHWFEFCMTHLFYALYDNWRKEDINCVTDFHLDLHNFKTHPIDYLYKKFKELQKLGYEF